MTRDELEIKKDELEQAYWKKLLKYLVVDFLLLGIMVVSLLVVNEPVGRFVFLGGMLAMFSYQMISYHVTGKHKRKLMSAYLSLDEEYLTAYADEVADREKKRLDELRKCLREEEKILTNKGLN